MPPSVLSGRWAYRLSNVGVRRPLLLVASLLLLTSALVACDDEPASTPPQSLAPEIVTYQAEDGLRIVADFYPPLEGGPAPAVLLLHEPVSSRTQLADLIPDLLQWGFGVLAPDLRGSGESTAILRGGVEDDYELNDLDDLLLDVAAAIDYLKTRSDVDAGGIGVVGVGLGGNLAYVGSGAFPEVQAAVSVSPDADPQGGALLGLSVSEFSPHAVLFITDEAGAAEAQTLADNVAEPVEVSSPAETMGQGVELLNDTATKAEIRGWLTVNLRIVSAE